MEHIINNYGMCLYKGLLLPEQVSRLKKDLFVKAEQKVKVNSFYKKPFKVYKETKYFYVVPIYYALQTFPELQYSIKFEQSEEIQLSNQIDITLREDQENCLELVKEITQQPFGGGIINLSTGSGKTILAIYIIFILKLKTLIIVNKTELLQQWTEVIKKLLNIEPGIIQGSKFDSDTPITIAMLQTLSLKDEINAKDLKDYQLTFIDEVHNISTEKFSEIMFKVRSKYLFGLTATLERIDGLERVIKWYIGPIIYSNISTDLKQQTDIVIYKYNPENIEEKYLRNGTIQCSSMISQLSENEKRNNLLVTIIDNLLENPDRNILVISERINQLKYLHKFIKDSGLFVGTQKSAALQLAKERRVLLATYSLVSEGFNLPKLNTLVFATPRSSITQTIGRIYRKEHTVTPTIVDIHDTFSIFNAQFYKRKKIYKESIENPRFILK